MKKYISVTTVALSFTLLWPVSTFAQTYGQDPTWNIIEGRIGARKMRARMKARKNGRKTVTKRNSSQSRRIKRTSRPLASKKTAPSLPLGRFSLHIDTFQDFHRSEGGYDVTYHFTPTKGTSKLIRKTCRYTSSDTAFYFNSLPAGTYNVQAEAVYKGKKYPVRLAGQDDSIKSSSELQYKPSIQVTSKAAKDFYGKMTIQVFPDTICHHVVE